MKKIATSGANSVLGYLDRLATNIQNNPVFFGLTVQAAKESAKSLDKVADTLETGIFGEDSLSTRQAEVLEEEPGDFFKKDMDNPQEPILIDPDDTYMKEFDTDVSTEVSDVFGNSGEWRQDNPFA